jgi:hypothetical protein
MRIKKFTCIQCGGPKVNPYTMPYIMCDFCGSFTDIDFRNEVPENPAKPIDCGNCGIANRLIQPQLGW